MGKKYIINSAGNIVAQRDIYSLGGFIPKGTIGATIADESVLSQDGESWITTSDKVIPATIRVTGNTFIWQIVSESVYTQTVREFSGDTLIPCNMAPQNISETFLARKSMYVNNCYIATEITVPFGPSTVTGPFSVEQGSYDYTASNKGCLFDNLLIESTTSVRTTASPVIGEATQLYVPIGMQARLFWAYQGDYGNFAYYAGETQVLQAGLHNLTGSIYKLCRMSFFKTDGTNLTPAQLQTSGVMLIRSPRRPTGSILVPLTESTGYSMKNSSVYRILNSYAITSNMSLGFSGWMENCKVSIVNPTSSAVRAIQGRFKNVGYMDSGTTVAVLNDAITAGRDTRITADNCPYLSIDNSTVKPSAIAAGGVTLRNCILPKGQFVDNPMNGNVYENIDFSFASEHVGANTGNANFKLMSGSKQGLYSIIAGGTNVVGLASYPGNLAAGAAVGLGNTNNPKAVAQITGYSYIGTGVYLYGDIQLHSQPYINRWISADMWERGSISGRTGATFEDLKQPEDIGYPRLRTYKPIEVRPGDVITCATGFWMIALTFNSAGISTAGIGWQNSITIPSGVTSVAILLKKATAAANAGDLILPSDVITAAVKYQSTPRTLRYITNEADRTSPDDTLLGPEAWRNGYTTNVVGNVGKTYDSITDNDSDWISGETPINADPARVTAVTIASTWKNIASSFSANLRLSASSDTNKALYAPSARKEPKVAITPNDVTSARLVLTYQPASRIVPPYGASALTVRGNGIRLYDNAVLSVGIDNPNTKIVLRGNAVMGELPATGAQCTCATGEEEAVIIKS